MMTAARVAATHPLQILLAGVALYHAIAPAIRALRAATSRKSVSVTPHTSLPLVA